MAQSSITILDHGPIYQETQLGRFPVEPWNTASNLIFLMTFIYWVRQVGIRFKTEALLSFNLVFLFIGYIGGTVYHATRSHPVWLFLDFVPIGLICLVTAMVYWSEIFKSRWKPVGFILAPFFVTRVLLLKLPLSPQLGISLGYVLLALTVIVPFFIRARLLNLKIRAPLIWATGLFFVAVAFRVLDAKSEHFGPFFAMTGTHWLWHLFGGLASFQAFRFIYLERHSRKALGAHF